MMRKINFVAWVLVLVLSGVTIYSFSLKNEEPVMVNETAAQKISQKIESLKIPDKVLFAGEEMPLWNYDVLERFDRELMVNVFFHSQTLKFIKKSKRYFDIIEPILAADTIPPDFKYLALAESGLDERAVSPSGAVGLWQFLSGTAKEYGLEVNSEVDERYHIEKATKAACRYLKDSYKKYGNWTMVAASYNVGRRGVDKQIKRQKEDDYYDLLLNEETSRYLYRITVLKTIIENQELYGFFVKRKHYYPAINYKTVEIKTRVEDFAEFASRNAINYKLLKDLNPWLRQSYLSNKSGKTYQIKIIDSRHRKFE